MSTLVTLNELNKIGGTELINYFSKLVSGKGQKIIKAFECPTLTLSNDFYFGHQCSWTLTPANSMRQVSIMPADNRKKK